MGEVTVLTVSMSIVQCVYFVIALSLTIYSTYNGKWKSNNGAKENESLPLVFYTAISFLIGLSISFINYVFVLVFGWSEGNISEYMFWIYSTVYAVALFLSILVWIKRLESVFNESIFSLSPMIVKSVKGLYFMIIFVGLLALILFIVSNNSIIIWTLSGVWALLFAVELGILMTLFITKLMKLRKMAMVQIKASDHLDVAMLEMTYNIWSLQVKLSILALTTIISTVVMLIISFTLDAYHDLMVLGTDGFIGFICVYCALKQHDAIYKITCILCVKLCDCCCGYEHIKTSLENEIEVIHSRTSGITQQLTVRITDDTQKRSDNITAITPSTEVTINESQ